MILGHGVDIVNNNRIANLVNKYGEHFKGKILSPKELIYYTNSNYLAKRFAAKEALSKAIGAGISKTGFQNVSVINNELGKPFIECSQKVKKLIIRTYNLSLNDIDKISFHLSLSDEKEYSIASIIMELRNFES